MVLPIVVITVVVSIVMVMLMVVIMVRVMFVCIWRVLSSDKAILIVVEPWMVGMLVMFQYLLLELLCPLSSGSRYCHNCIDCQLFHSIDFIKNYY